MKKKYCAPVIKAVLFKAEEAVSTCIISPTYGDLSVTPKEDEDDWAEYTPPYLPILPFDYYGWIKKYKLSDVIAIPVPGHRGYIFTSARKDPDRPNHS